MGETTHYPVDKDICKEESDNTIFKTCLIVYFETNEQRFSFYPNNLDYKWNVKYEEVFKKVVQT